MKNLLLLSNSTIKGEPYFNWPLAYVKHFTERLAIKKVAFVPYAAITFSFDEYEALFQKAVKHLGIEVISVHKNPDAINQTDAIAVGGGNTFALLKKCYEEGLVERISNLAQNGKPYMGWSAGANLACPFLSTSNDMPIAQPPSFEALNLIPFQINPHYTNKVIDGHGGESRDTRLNEYITYNQEMEVAAIPEGSLIEISDNIISFKGVGPMKRFKYGETVSKYFEGDDISFLLK